jgi:hypothetical protein
MKKKKTPPTFLKKIYSKTNKKGEMEHQIKSDNIHQVARVTALISFIVGSLLFTLYLFLKDDNIVLVGLFYVLIAVVVNLIVLFALLLAFSKPNINYEQNVLSIGILLSNIPIAIIYLYIIFYDGII